MKADKRFDRVEAQNVGSHVSDHPSLVGEEPVLAVWFGAGTFLLDAEVLKKSVGWRQLFGTCLLGDPPPTMHLGLVLLIGLPFLTQN